MLLYLFRHRWVGENKLMRTKNAGLMVADLRGNLRDQRGQLALRVGNRSIQPLEFGSSLPSAKLLRFGALPGVVHQQCTPYHHTRADCDSLSHDYSLINRQAIAKGTKDGVYARSCPRRTAGVNRPVNVR